MKRLIALVIVATLAGSSTAQETTGKKKGSIWGAGLGAIAGGIYGGHGSDALIGAAIGTGIGYLIGNESDKKKAKEMSAQPPAQRPNETAAFAGTSWRLQDWAPKTGKEEFKSKAFAFSKDGWVTTTTVHKDGRKASVRENYRVVGDTLIINRDNYLVNCKFNMQGDQLMVDTQSLRATLQKI
jgi:hypothetical protein